MDIYKLYTGKYLASNKNSLYEVSVGSWLVTTVNAAHLEGYLAPGTVDEITDKEKSRVQEVLSYNGIDASAIKVKNQISSRDLPNLYDGIDIDMDKLGCIMIDTEKIPVSQYVKNFEDDLYEETSYDQGALPSETVPHATLLFGLLENGNIWKDKVDMVLDGWELPSVTIEAVSFFDLGDSKAIIGLLEKTPEIVDGHERLTLLPHINTFSEYHPHITLAYIKKEADEQKWIKALSKVYNGQKVSTKGINYGDKPEDSKASNVIEAQEAILSPLAASSSHNCAEHEHVTNSTMEVAKNALDPAIKDSVILQQANLEKAVADLEGRVAAAVIEALRNEDIIEAERLISEAQEEGFVAELIVIFVAFYTILFPIYATQLMLARLAEYGMQGFFEETKAVGEYIRESAENAARSHIATIIRDFSTALDKAADKAIREELVQLIEQDAREQKPHVLTKLPKNPNREDIIIAVDAGKFDKDPAYATARKLVREGRGLDEIIRALKAEYAHMTTTRAKTIARHESSRVFTMSQFQADLQFLTQAGLMDRAYKRLRSRTGDPCAVCSMLIANSHIEPIPFKTNFADLGDELTASYRKDNGKIAVQKIPIGYEAIAAGNVHVNCNCEYELVIKNEDGTFINSIDFRVDNGLGYNPYRDTKGRFDDGITAVKIGKMKSKTSLPKNATADDINLLAERLEITSREDAVAKVFDKLKFNELPSIVDGQPEGIKLMRWEAGKSKNESYKFRNDMINSEERHLPAFSIFGSGTYFGSDEKGIQVYKTKKSVLTTATIDKSMKVASFKEVDTYRRELLALDLSESGADLVRDHGVVAALMGYDAIITGAGIYSIMNRSKLIFGDQDE